MTRHHQLVTLVASLCIALASSCTSQRPATPPAPAPPPPAAVAELSERLDAVLRRLDGEGARFTARVIDLETGRELYAVRPDEPFMPASNMKIPVSAAALDHFGPDHAFKTYLALDGDDLWLIGTGDPGTGDPRIARKHGGTPLTMLDRWADALLARGVTTVAGDLLYYEGALDDQRTHPSWSRGYITEWYAAPVSGLNFNDNCVDITVTPTKEGEKAAFTVMPPTKGVGVINHVTTGQGGGGGPSVDRAQDHDVFSIHGATTKPMELKSKAVTDPAAFFADALRTHLMSRGITIQGEIRRADEPLGGVMPPPVDRIVAVHETQMRDALPRINKNSQNLFAEAFCKVLGRAYRAEQGRDEPGSWAAGGEAIRAFLAENGIDPAGLIVADGSGLSRENRVTGRLISDLLVRMRTHRYADAFFDSLSVAGEDGTLSGRMKDLKGHVFAKTGSIGGVRACSGYAKTRDGKWLVFSIIYNGPRGLAEEKYTALQDEAIRLLVAYPNLPPATRPTTAATAADR